MAENPILEIFKQTVESGGDLASARQVMAARAKAGQIAPQHILEIGAFLSGDKAKTALSEDARILLSALLFQAAQSHPSLDNRLRFATAMTFLQAIPGRRKDLLRFRVEALQTALSLVPQDFPEQGKTALLGDIGASLAQLGERSAALSHLQQALEIYRRLADAEPAAFEPDVAMTLNNLGALLSDLGDRAGAREKYEEALEIYRRLADAEPAAFEADVAMTLNNLGNLLRDSGEPAAARERYEEALPLARGGEPTLHPSILSNLGMLLYDSGEQRRGLERAWEAVREIETLAADSRHAGVRFSFKGEIENAYRLVLCDPILESDKARAHRLVEALREGELLGEMQPEEAGHFAAEEALGGQQPTVLKIQRTHDGVLFLDSTEGLFEQQGAPWIEAAEELLKVVQSEEALRPDGNRLVATAGQKLWRALPEPVQALLSNPPAGGIALSLDPDHGVLPLEFLTETGEPKDFLCLKMEMPRVPGERLFRECQERGLIDAQAHPQAAIFGNPTGDLEYCREEAVDLGCSLDNYDFTLLHDGRAAWVCEEATKERFLECLARGPSIIHFTGHGATKDEEECLVFAGARPLFADELSHFERFPHHPFVFLSSCLTGRVRANGGAFRGLPMQFLRLGAAAVVASVFLLYPTPSARFSEILYRELLSGTTVGEAMLHTRREMFNGEVPCIHWGRPILYGNPHARLVLPKRG